MIGKYMLFLVASATMLFSIIPAYAEVTSLSTSAPFYKGGSTIYFTGSTADTDPPNVTIIVFDPNNKFISLLSGMADSTHHFQVSLDTSDPSHSQQFTIKGTYNATAFIATKENGKTVNFIFSPDGSPVIPSSPLSLTASVPSSTEIDLSWSAPTNTGGTTLSGYRVDRSADNGATWTTVAPNVINTVTSYPDTGLAPSTIYSYRVVAVNPAGSSNPSNVVTSSTLASAPSTPPQQVGSSGSSDDSSLSLDELLKKRLEDAKRLQEILNGQTSQSSGSTQGTQQSINLAESMSVDDISSSLSSTNSNSTTGTSPIPANWNNVIYPAIALVGVGIVVFILYQRKKLTSSMPRIKKAPSKVQDTPSVEASPEKETEDEDYAMAILKNRLAKGEITIEQFKEIKDELSEP